MTYTELTVRQPWQGGAMINLEPKNYTELLRTAKSATCLAWFRDAQNLELCIEDKVNDKRTCISCYFTLGVKGVGRCDIKTLCGVDSKHNIRTRYRWTRYCAPKGSINFVNRRGKAQLLQWLKTKALEKCAWIPNPPTLFLHANV